MFHIILHGLCLFCLISLFFPIFPYFPLKQSSTGSMVTAQALPSLVPQSAGSTSSASIKAESPPRLIFLCFKEQNLNDLKFGALFSLLEIVPIVSIFA